jgi:putative PIN family toxin of toxin-antitoxin system
VRAVIDTNVLVSGLLWHGPPHALIEQVRNGALTLISSPALIAEFTTVVRRAKFRKALSRSGTDVMRMVAEVRLLADIVETLPLPAPVSRDPDDDAVLALAAAAQPDLIISGDRDLLVLHSFAGIPIVTPAQAIAMLGP